MLKIHIIIIIIIIIIIYCNWVFTRWLKHSKYKYTYYQNAHTIVKTSTHVW